MGIAEHEPRPAWVPTDPRQRDIARRLSRLLGEAPASFFLDACELMARGELRATSHLVASLLRELEGSLRGVLRARLSAEQQATIAQAGDETHRAEIHAMCDLLGLSEHGDVRSAWQTFAVRQLSTRTHRNSLYRPRPVDDEFDAWWALGQVVLDRVTLQFETVYGEALPQIEVLAAKERPIRADVTLLREGIPHGAVTLDRFFAEATPGWFEPLRDAGYFAHPPRLQPDEDGQVSYVPWPQGRFLVRLADGIHRDEIVELVRDLETDNPEAQETIADVAIALPAGVAVRLVPRVANSLGAPFQWRLPYRARELIAHLAAGHEIAAALELLRPLVGPHARGGIGTHRSSMVEGLVEELFPAAGLPGAELIADMLDEQVDIEDGDRRRNDLSYAWRPALESGHRHDARDAYVSALRAAARTVVTADRTMLEPVVEMLERRERSIFARLALDLLRRFPDENLVGARLGDRARFDAFGLEREYDALAREQFGALPAEVRERIFEWVGAGPDLDDVPEADHQERFDRWQWWQLGRLGDDLPPDWLQRRDELVARYGTPEVDRQRFAVWSVSESPVAKDDLAVLSVPEIVSYLAAWTPDGSFDGHTRGGLGRTLSEVVADDAGRFADEAERFTGLLPVYVEHLVRGLEAAVKAGRPFGWQPVLVLGRHAVAQPRVMVADGVEQRDWITVREKLADLITVGCVENVIPVELADDVWALLETLAADPDPDIAKDNDGAHGYGGPSLVALNSVRGAAIRAVIGYAWWRTQSADGDAPVLEPRLRDLLDRHLSAGAEPTRAIRSIYGQYFRTLIACDEDWALDRAATIFRLDGPSAALGTAAWESYLRFNNPSGTAFGRLRPQYSAALDATLQPPGPDAEHADPDERAETSDALIRHLIGLFYQGLIQQEDDLLGRFLRDAAPDARAKLIERIGIDLMNTTEEGETIPEGLAERLRALWGARLQTLIADDSPRALRELRGFAWWFASEQFDDVWSLDQLRALLEARGTVDPDHIVVKRLASLRNAHLQAVVECLERLIAAMEGEPWFVLGSRDDLRTILIDGLAADDEATQNAARAATNRLVARGHGEFGELLAFEDPR